MKNSLLIVKKDYLLYPKKALTLAQALGQWEVEVKDVVNSQITI